MAIKIIAVLALLLAVGASAQDTLGASAQDTLGDARIKFNYTLNIAPHGDYVALTTTPTVEANWGCGSDGSKCSCVPVFDSKAAVPTQVVMAGVGVRGDGVACVPTRLPAQTTGTATGLDFECQFDVQFYNTVSRNSIPGCSCKLHVAMPETGSNTWTTLCPCLSGFKSAVGPKDWEVVMTDTVQLGG